MDKKLEELFIDTNELIRHEVLHNNKKLIKETNLNYSNEQRITQDFSNVSTGSIEIDYAHDGWDVNPPFTSTLLRNNVFRFFYNKNWNTFPVNTNLNNQSNTSAVVGDITNVYVDRNHKEYGRMFAGLEREDIPTGYSDVFIQTEVDQFNDVIALNTLRESQSISKAQDLWRRYVTGGSFSDIISASSHSQKEVIFNDTYLNESLLLHGYAGTGKTYVLNEVSQKVNRSLNLYPNQSVKDKSIGFFKALGSKGVSCYTFKEYDQLIKCSLDRLTDKVWAFNDKEWMKSLADGESNIEVLEGIGVSIKQLKGIDTKIGIKLEFKRLWNKNISSEEIDNILVGLEGYKQAISNLLKLKEVIIADNNISTIAIDEAPMVLEYQYLNAFIKSTIKQLHYIVSYDKFQHDRSDTFESIDNVETLNEVYRTTKEIFQLATMSVDIYNVDVPVSIKDSVTFSDKAIFKDKIALSQYIEDPLRYIGDEYLELSIEIDVNPNRVKPKHIYTLFTRAIAKVNVYGKYKEEVEEWV